MANWGDLPKELMANIAEHLEYHEDFVALRGVCYCWRLAVKDAKFRALVDTNSSTLTSLALPRDHRGNVPWLMLEQANRAPSFRRFFSLCDHNVREVEVPPNLIPCQWYYNEQGFLSSRGWLLSISRHKVNDTSLYLFNPFSGELIQLPTLTTWCHMQGRISPFVSFGLCVYKKFFLSADPSTTSDYCVALILVEPFPHLCWHHEIVVTWRNGTENWVQIELPKLEGPNLFNHAKFCNDISFYRGEFYAVDDRGFIFAFGIGQSHPRMVANLADRGYFSSSYDVDDIGSYPTPQSTCKAFHKRTFFYLLELADKLLLICRVKRLGVVQDNDYYYLTTSFRVFDIDVENRDAKELHNLGNKAIFISFSSSFSVEASPSHGCKPNCIYYADDYRSYNDYCDSKGKDTGIYNMKTRKIKSLNYSPSFFRECTIPPMSAMWVESCGF